MSPSPPLSWLAWHSKGRMQGMDLKSGAFPTVLPEPTIGHLRKKEADFKGSKISIYKS